MLRISLATVKKTGNSWQLWVDTGGTFTDCLAYNPNSKLHRIKVLSSGVLRGKILDRVNENTIRVHVLWGNVQDIFSGYQFHFLKHSHEAVEITSTQLQKGLITLSALPNDTHFPDTSFEITAREEAPVLAARLLTGTGLQDTLPPIEMRLGSTKGTNAILEKKGAKVTLLITKGFADLLEIGTQQRPHIFSLNVEKSSPLYTQTVEIDERLDAKGNVITALTNEEITKVVDAVIDSQVESVAIATMHSYLNDDHEQQIKRALKEKNGCYISCSAELAPSIKLLPRTETAVVNAYLAPIFDRYLQKVSKHLTAGSLKVMSSAGGLMDASLFHPKDSLLSGPAGGVVGAASIAQQIGSYTEAPQLITLDMGGTSTDVARYDGKFDYRYELQIGDVHILLPSLSIETVAAGGGSLCYFDGHKLSVGPESAGAQPGPACYGAGGPLSITDINLLSGRITHDKFGIPIYREAAQTALNSLKEELTQKTGNTYKDEEILSGFLAIANEKMAEAIRKISVRKGYDPKNYTLLAFGGVGGQHACQVAQLLEMKKVIVPYDAGLLSAYGMGQAVIERFATRQVILSWEKAKKELNKIIPELKEEAHQQMKKEGYEEDEITLRFIKLFLRFKGQESALEIDYQDEMDIIATYRQQYENLYGHWVENRDIELESVKVIMSTLSSVPERPSALPDNYYPSSKSTTLSFTGGQWKEIPVYFWEELKPGACIDGPALVLSTHCAVAIDARWVFSLDVFNNAILEQYQGSEKSEKAVAHTRPKEIQLELFTNRFTAIAEEMGALLERVSFSVNVKERLDFSCAVLDDEGYLVVNAPHIPVHLGSLGMCVRAVKDILPMRPNDVIITNHPGFGGSHLPDITLIAPVFTDDEVLAGYVANRAHHAEIGGKRPGSMPPDAANLAEEGVVISPAYLVKAGKAQWDYIKEILTQSPYPTRALEENLADLNGALASIRLGVDSLRKLCHTFGVSEVQHYMHEIKEYARICLEDSLAKREAGEYMATEYLDDDTPLHVRIKISPRQITFDFTGSGDIHPGNLNATPAIVNSALMYVLRLMINQNTPLNEGMMQVVQVHLPKGLLNPAFPEDITACPAVVGGNTETSQRLVDTLLKALKMAACSQGTMNNLLFGNDTFGYYETIGGGVGAGNGFHGASAVHQHMTNTRITDPEVFELRYPARLEAFSIRKNSGGKGKWRGGDGILRKITFLEPVALTLLSQHRKYAPYGLEGGEEGKPGQQYIIRKNGHHEMLSGIDKSEILPGDCLVIETPGGGGFAQKSK